MNTFQILWLIGLMPLSLLVCVFAYIYSSRAYKHAQNRAFDLRSEFPFELMDARISSLKMGRVFLIIWGVLDVAVSTYLLASIQSHSFLLWMAVIYTISVLLRDISLIFLFFIPAFNFKPHFLAFVSSCGLTAFSGASAVIACVQVREFVGNAALWFAIGIGVVSMFAMLIMVNPKLSNWAKLESTVDESGAVVERRPKYFILAFSEWLVLFSAILLSVLNLVAFVVFDLL